MNSQNILNTEMRRSVVFDVLTLMNAIDGQLQVSVILSGGYQAT